MSLLVLLLAPLITADFASVHVHNYLNHSVSPCDNFYRHVCASGMTRNETVAAKSEKFYNDLAEKYRSRTRNNPIMNDISTAWADPNCTFDSDIYTSSLRDRCKDTFDCYFNEFLYFYDAYSNGNDDIDDSLRFYSTHGNNTERLRTIPQAILATSQMIQSMYEDPGSSAALNDTIDMYIRTQDRLFVMEILNEDGTPDHVGLEKIQSYTGKLREVLLAHFKATKWMNVTNRYGFNILNQFEIVLNELNVTSDFDAFDRNLTFLRKFNREISSKYFRYSERATSCEWFDVLHSFSSASKDMVKVFNTTVDNQLSFARIEMSLKYNAFNYVDYNRVVVFAPTFYPLTENSSETTMIAFAGDILGHEMYHSFVTDALVNRSAEFRREAECLQNHYNATCLLFAETECNSGPITFVEDGCDVEGIRAAYKLLLETFTMDELDELEYPDLNISRRQSFFYSVAMRSCTDLSKGKYKEHSPDNIRVNALVSQLPQFSEAFGCVSGEEMYAEESQVCYLFGEKSDGSNLVDSGAISGDAVARMLNGL